jgi:uncharacterized membrane protein
MDAGIFKGLEALLIFGGFLAFCLHQLWSLKRDARLRAEREAADAAAGHARQDNSNKRQN